RVSFPTSTSPSHAASTTARPGSKPQGFFSPARPSAWSLIACHSRTPCGPQRERAERSGTAAVAGAVISRLRKLSCNDPGTRGPGSRTPECWHERLKRASHTRQRFSTRGSLDPPGARPYCRQRLVEVDQQPLQGCPLRGA